METEKLQHPSQPCKGICCIDLNFHLMIPPFGRSTFSGMECISIRLNRLLHNLIVEVKWSQSGDVT